MEMNSTFRGAVEVFNLCRHLHPNDVLFAECIRTFSSMVIDGRSWLQRLDALERDTGGKGSVQFDMDVYVPPTKRPNVRTDRSNANNMDIYGFRPLRHPWKLLSVYENLMNWRAEPLLVPSEYTNKGVPPMTVWTEKGKSLIQMQIYIDGDAVAHPGTISIDSLLCSIHELVCAFRSFLILFTPLYALNVRPMLRVVNRCFSVVNV